MSHRTLSSMVVFIATALAVLSPWSGLATATDDPLPSWNDGPAKQAMVDFVQLATAGSETADSVPPAERIAVFDNDGTLWCEQPMYVQVVFAFDRVKELAPEHPEWQTTEPFRSILTDDRAALAKIGPQDFEQVIVATHTGMTVEEFQAIVKRWLATAQHPRFKRPYTELAYQPMLEVLQYFRDHGIKTYIVTGGGQEFVRTFASEVYGVPPQQVIGSAGKLKYEYDAVGRPILVKESSLLLLDDKAGKPEDIQLFLGRRPIAAFGNSTGDQQMLEWTDAGSRARLMMLVHHDDAEREYAYGAESKVGTFSDALMTEAHNRHWTIISMKRDWRVVFPPEK